MDRGKHSRFEKIAWIMKLHSDLGGAGLLVDVRIDISHSATELPVWQVRQADGHLLAQPDVSQVLFINLRLNPNQAQIGQTISFRSRVNHLSLNHHFLHDEPILWSIDPERLAGLTGALQV